MVRDSGAPRRSPGWLVALVLAVACSRNPATGRLQFGLPDDDEEIAIGKEKDGEVTEALGLYGELPAANAMVEGIGKRIAKQSERPDLPWTFRILDEPAVNAFALPGGYVYVTRGLLAHLDSDDELAAVLAHETGHVTARHGVVQMRKTETARRSVGLFRVIDPGLRHVGGLAARAAGLSLLRYSREDEHEADDLSVRYVRQGGWDPAAVVRVFGVLTRLQKHAPKPPPWLSTHPDPNERRGRTAVALGIAADQPSAPEEGYLRAIDGLAFGDDPRDGFLAGTTFVQPRKGFQIELPGGWKTLHDKASVFAMSADDRAVFLLLETESKTPDEALKGFFADGAMSPGKRWDGTVGGFPVSSSTFGLSDEDGRVLVGLVAFVAFERKVLAMLAIGPEEGWSARADALAHTFASFAKADAKLRDVEPMRVHVKVLDAATTIAELAKGGPVDASTLALVNQVGETEPLAKGRAVKVVSPSALGGK